MMDYATADRDVKMRDTRSYAPTPPDQPMSGAPSISYSLQEMENAVARLSNLVHAAERIVGQLAHRPDAAIDGSTELGKTAPPPITVRAMVVADRANVLCSQMDRALDAIAEMLMS